MTDGDTTLCFGCRAIEGEPRSESDVLPGGAVPDGFVWERFKCGRCGIEDVRLVRAGYGHSKGSPE